MLTNVHVLYIWHLIGSFSNKQIQISWIHKIHNAGEKFSGVKRWNTHINVTTFCNLVISKMMISDVRTTSRYLIIPTIEIDHISVTHFKCSKECGFFGFDKRPGIHPFDRWNILSILKFNRLRNWPNSSRSMSSSSTCWCSDTITFYKRICHWIIYRDIDQ